MPQNYRNRQVEASEPFRCLHQPNVRTRKFKIIFLKKVCRVC